MLKKLRFILVFCLFCLATAALAQGDMPTFDELDTDAWTQIAVSGATCARGTPYSFFVRPGDPSKLAVGFQGGGACWNATTCSVDDGTFDDTISEDELVSYGGVFDLDNPANPLADWSFVFIPYCTADVHSGDATIEYTDDLTIEHSGVENARAVLDWTYANFESVAQLFITGSSAGAYGAIYHAPSLIMQYPDAQTFVFGDAGLGVLPAEWEGTAIWNSLDNVPENEAYSDVGLITFNNDLYAAGAALFPGVLFAEYSSARDGVQVGFYGLMGADPDEWVTRAPEVLDELDPLPNFSSYLAWGSTHTILATPLFYTMQTNGVRFLDWFTAQLNGEAVGSVRCEDCNQPELYTSG